MNGLQSRELRRRGTGRGYGIVDLRPLLELRLTAKTKEADRKTKELESIMIYPVGGRGRKLTMPAMPTILIQNVKDSKKRGLGRGEIIKTLAETPTQRNMGDWGSVSDDEDTSPAEKALAIQHIFENILEHLIGFDKLNLINVYPRRRCIYKHIITKLSTHDEQDNLFF